MVTFREVKKCAKFHASIIKCTIISHICWTSNGLKDESLGNQSQKRKQKASNDEVMPSKKKKDTEEVV